MYQGCIPKKTKNRRPIDEIAPKKQKMYLVPRYVYICRYLMYQGYIPPQKNNRRPIDEIAKKNKIKNNLNTELKEMGVFSAVAGNQLPNQLQKRVLPALFHLRCLSQSHHRSARGRTRLTTVTSISCRSFQRQLLYLFAKRCRTQNTLLNYYQEKFLMKRSAMPVCLLFLGTYVVNTHNLPHGIHPSTYDEKCHKISLGTAGTTEPRRLCENQV